MKDRRKHSPPESAAWKAANPWSEEAERSLETEQLSEKGITMWQLFSSLLLAPMPLMMLFAAASKGAMHPLVISMPLIVVTAVVASTQLASNGPLVTITTEAIDTMKKSSKQKSAPSSSHSSTAR